MSEIITVGLDLAKNVFQAHGADASGRVLFRKKLRRDQALPFFSQQPSCVVAMEACGGGHFWGREIGKPGHEVRLIPLAYVKPFVKRQKNDMADVEAMLVLIRIGTGPARPTMSMTQGSSRHGGREGRRCGAWRFGSMHKMRAIPLTTPWLRLMTARLAGYLEGEAVGGIGISSGTSAQDRDVAEAAIAAWAAV